MIPYGYVNYFLQYLSPFTGVDYFLSITYVILPGDILRIILSIISS